jgi:hypothetical protein
MAKDMKIIMTKNRRKKIDALFYEMKERHLQNDRNNASDKENNLIKRFGAVRLKELRLNLDFIQNNEFANQLFSTDTPFKVTQEELLFLEEEDKLNRRYFVDFTWWELTKDEKTFYPRWIREPFQTDTQVKRTLEWINETNQKVEGLSIISENVLDEEVNCLMKDGSYKHYPLRVVRFDERYDWRKLSWMDKIKLTHNVFIKVVPSITN